MRRCPECGSWEVECDSDTPVPNCGCKRCLSARLAEVESRGIERDAEIVRLKTDLRDVNQQFAYLKGQLADARESLAASRAMLRDEAARAEKAEAELASMTASRDRLAALVKAYTSFIDDVGSFNDGCGCCGNGLSVQSELKTDDAIRIAIAAVDAAGDLKGGAA